jgi:lipopolysaccharide transport system permease protein/teichoic acid transport system permease protein
MVLSGGIGFLCAALQVFFRDVQKIVEAVTMVWFWLTPIVWSVSQLGPAHKYWIMLNPAYYIVTGYRDSLIYGVPFWQHGAQAALFWTEAALLLALGLWVFERLKPEFAELV